MNQTSCINKNSRKECDCLLENLSNNDATESKTSPSKIQVVSENGSKCAINVEESSSSFKSWSTNTTTKSCKHSRSLSNDLAVEPEFHSGSKCDTFVSGKQNGVAHPITHHSQYDKYIACRAENDIIYIKAALCTAGEHFNIDSLEAAVGCLYYLQFPTEKRSEGLLRIIQHIKCAGSDIKLLENFEKLKEHL